MADDVFEKDNLKQINMKDLFLLQLPQQGPCVVYYASGHLAISETSNGYVALFENVSWIHGYVIVSGASHCRPNPMSNKLFRVADANSSAMVHRLAFSPPSRNPSSSCALIKQKRWCTIMQKRSGRAGGGGTRRRWMQRKSKSTPT